MLEYYLAHYLPHKVKYYKTEDLNYIEDDGIKPDTLIGLVQKRGRGINEGWYYEGNCHEGLLKEIMPLLRPFSHLVKEIDIGLQHKGELCEVEFETIVPAIEITKLADGTGKHISWNNSEIENIQDHPNAIPTAWKVNVDGTEKNIKYRMEILNTYDCYFVTQPDTKKEFNEMCCKQIEIFQFLLKHHFDIFNLISQNLAISYDDLKTKGKQRESK